MSGFSNLRQPRRRGFTLIELMVVIMIVGILFAMIFPAFTSMFENANALACRNNMQQTTRAMQAYQSQLGYYPSSWSSTRSPSGSSDVSGWSAQAKLLPFLEQGKLFKNIDFNQPYSSAIQLTTADGVTTALGAIRVPSYLCPSEARDEIRYGDGEPEHYPINYVFNLGTWFVYDPETGKGGDGAFYPDSKLKPAAFRDGLNETLCMAEVKGWNPYYRNKGESSVPTIPDATAADFLTSGDICSMGGDFKDSSGHTEWIDGRAHQTGFTTAYPPNAQLLCDEDGEMYDVDWTNWQEGKGLAAGSPTLTPTYAAVTARSYHPGGVNVSMMGGSVHTVAEDINPLVWRAYSTRAGDEIIPNDKRISE